MLFLQNNLASLLCIVSELSQHSYFTGTALFPIFMFAPNLSVIRNAHHCFYPSKTFEEYLLPMVTSPVLVDGRIPSL